MDRKRFRLFFYFVSDDLSVENTLTFSVTAGDLNRLSSLEHIILDFLHQMDASGLLDGHVCDNGRRSWL